MKQVSIVLVFASLLSALGCGESALPVMVAARAAEPVVVDGKLDEAVWSQARVYPMNLAQDRQKWGIPLQEGGQVRLAWDDKNLYVGIVFDDTDVVAQGTKDGQALFQKGDTCELFLWPRESYSYWEIYATPNNFKTSYHILAGGRIGLGGTFDNYDSGLTTAATVQGTLNDPNDRDTSWTAELAVPIEALQGFGDKFGPGQDWRILVARYNYSLYLLEKSELSMTPRLSRTDYHTKMQYARLRLAQ